MSRSQFRRRRSARATRSAAQAPRSRITPATSSCSPATRRSSPAHCSRSSSRRTSREEAAATILSAEPPDPRLYGRIVRGPDGSVRIVEGTDASDEEQQIREINSSIYVFRSDKLWPALERLEPHNAQGELYLTDAIEIIATGGGKVAAHIAADSRETDGVNTRVELAYAAAVLRDRINEEPHARRRDDRRSEDDVDRPDRRDRARRDDPALRDPPWRHGGCDGGRDRRRTRSRSTPGSAPERRSGRSVTFALGRSSRRLRRRAPSWRSRTHASATARRCLTSRTSATPRSATTRTSAPARSPRTSRTSRASRRAGRRSGATSGPVSTMASSRPSRSETEHGLPPDR